ncbi:MAG: UDP-N-acetylmuramoyl-L-alanyl-D-glutamate--2,6-diaminopimelate ligase [Janthinobacterium lividum]
MRLAELLPGAALGSAGSETEVQGLTADSRAVQPGFVFFAVPGTRGDGLAYAAAARSAGAVAVVAERSDDGPVVLVPSVRRSLSEAAARFYPEQPSTIVAVTGTSGKTSVAAFVRQIWIAAGARAASLGTLGIVAPDGAVYGSLTTPDPVTLHRDIDRLARDGVSHLALEASSHGLDQHRLDGLRLAAGAFTNLSRDHLDYHSSVEAYLAAKLRLFGELLPPGATAVIDADSDASAQVIDTARARGLTVMTVGWQGDGIRLLSAEPRGFSTRIVLRHAAGDRTLDLPLAGLFQVFNALVAAGLCIATGTSPDLVFASLEHLVGAPGRLERVGETSGAPILIDYAHKPDALDKVLQTLRPYAERRLVVVFGCGGDRDAGKRPMMGEIATRLADVVIVTDDNPRSEDPATIRAAILAAAPGAIEIGDRAEAIRHAVSSLGPGDVLVVAGKGHETGQTIAGATLPFSDAEAVAAALAGIRS